ncbi:MAG: hypothetical protein GY786_16350 [Proteobacteria bacterium]|nr:hypothetical protein [Pseudomonadota bacterium]
MELIKEKIFLRSKQFENILRHPIYKKRGRNFVKDQVTDRSEQFVQELFEGEINQEIKTIYNNLKKLLRLRRKQINKNIITGAASLETDFFQYSIEITQNIKDPGEAVIARFLSFQKEISNLPEGLDDVFPLTMDEVVVPTLDLPDFDDLVERFEDLEDKEGGNLQEDDQELIIQYRSPMGFRVVLDIKEKELIIIPQKSYPVLKLLAEGLIGMNAILS